MIEKIALVIPGNGADNDIQPIQGMPSSGSNVTNLIGWGTTTLLIVASLLCLVFIIYGGIQWSSSGGDKSAVESARKKVVYAVIGLIVAFSSFMIINTVGWFLGIDLLNLK